MSFDLMAKAMKVKLGNPIKKLVFLKLCDNASDQGECWPSYQHIADQCEIGRTTVIKHINELCDMGYLSKVHRKGEKGNSSNLYYIKFRTSSPSELGGSPNTPPPSSPSEPRTNNSFESINEPIKNTLCQNAFDCLDYFNQVTGSKLKKETKSHIENIKARLRDGYSVDDIKLVIDYKHLEWKDKPEMAQYIRPSTLFQTGKFNGYLMAAKTNSSKPSFNLSEQNYVSGDL